MSRVTKAIAEEVAIKLTQPKQDEIDKLKNEFKLEIRELYLATIPKEISEMKDKHPKYFKTSSRITLSQDFRWMSLEYFSINNEGGKDREYHITESDYNDPNVKLEGKDLKKFHTLYLQIDGLKGKLQNLQFEISTALCGFKTYKKVETEFPEAFLLLPVKEVTTLVVDVKSIRNKLK